MAASNEAVAGKVRKWLRLVTAVLCGTMLLALTFVTVIDVVGRYVLNHPLPGAGEYTELLLMSIIFVGLPAVCLDDGHISVDLLTTRFTGRLKTAQLLLTRVVVALLLGVIAWQLWRHGAQLASYNQVTVYLRVPIAPFAKAAAMIAGACAIVTLVMGLLRMPDGSEEGSV